MVNNKKTKKQKPKRKATGRPPLTPGELAVNVGFKLPEDDWSRLLEVAERENVAHSEIIRRALKKYLDLLPTDKFRV